MVADAKAPVGKGWVWVLGFFVAWWSVFVVGYDFVVVRDLGLQLRALGFPTVTADITGSAVDGSPFPQRRSYDPVVRYRYVVGGKPYEGQLRHRLSVSSPAWAEDRAGRYFPGVPVHIAYDPRDPGTSIIEPGVRSMDLLALLFCIPFNVVMLVMWYAVSIAWRDRHGPPLAGAARIIRSGAVVRARIPHMAPWLAAGLAAGASTFALLIVFVALWPGEPSRTTAVCSWILVLGVAGYFWRRRRLLRDSGVEDLVIDHRAATIIMPLEIGRTTFESVPISAVVKVSAEEITETKKDGKPRRHWQPSLQLRDRPQPLPISRWGNAELARAFAAWVEHEVAQDSRRD